MMAQAGSNSKHEEANQPPPYGLQESNIGYQGIQGSPQTEGGYGSQQLTHTIYTTQPEVSVTVCPPKYMWPHPVDIRCPSCGLNVTTVIAPHNGALTWLLCGTLCLFGCWLGCQFIPFYCNCSRDIHHMCPNCNASIGDYKRI